MDFARKELDGVRYAESQYSLLQALAAWDGVQSRELQQAAEHAQRLDVELADKMDARAAANAVHEAVNALIASRQTAGLDNAFDAATTYISKVEDGSNLTLDPDLDSYYSQDCSMVKLPALVVAARRVLGAALVLQGNAQPSPEQILVFLSRKSDFSAALSGIDSDLVNAEHGNASGLLKPIVDIAHQALMAEGSDFIKVLELYAETKSAQTVDQITSRDRKILDLAHALWGKTNQGVRELLQARIDALMRKMLQDLLIAFMILAAAIVVAWKVAQSISSPLQGLQLRLGALIRGDFDTPIPFAQRLDEVGGIAKAMVICCDEMRKNAQFQAEKSADQAARVEEAAAQGRLMSDFNEKLSKMIGTIISAGLQLEENSQTMSGVLGGTVTRTRSVSVASSLAAENLQMVAAAAEELAYSSRDIGSQAQRSGSISQKAADEAERTDQIVQGLASAVGKIGTVVSMITDIAGRTNLLAMNATIEAARAGEAGKGFAVVAGEVKHLANQTAKATDEITVQIQEVQEQTEKAVTAIRSITDTIHQIDAVASSIATSIGSQDEATADITRNIQQAYAGTNEVAGNVAQVSEDVTENDQMARQVAGAARGLTTQAEALRAMADSFFVSFQSGGATLEWGPHWLTGHPVIDQDHKMLVQYVNELNTAMMQGKGRDISLEILHKLVAYTRDHFAREEIIWDQGGLASLSGHKQIHAKLVREVEEFERSFASGSVGLTTELMTFLRDWLVHHVFKIDKNCVQEIMSPAS